MQSVHTRMRRAVEKENQDLDAKAAARKSRQKRPRRQKVNFCLPLIVLSPILILGAFIYVARQYSTWSQAEAEANNMVPDLKRDLKTDLKKDLKNERLRKRKTEHKHSEEVAKPKFLVLKTQGHGNIKITLRPDLSPGSVEYIYKLVESYGEGNRCMHCNLYRSEKPGILQGIMEHKGVVPVNTVRGNCPEGAEDVPNDCPEWDQHCGCHGPVMTKGAVAWAAGDAGGPDFFIDAYPNPAKWWGTQHTNFGFIEDMAVVDAIFELPVYEEGGMTFLKDQIHFDLHLE